jgi:hypothetical protein
LIIFPIPGIRPALSCDIRRKRHFPTGRKGGIQCDAGKREHDLRFAVFAPHRDACQEAVEIQRIARCQLARGSGQNREAGRIEAPVQKNPDFRRTALAQSHAIQARGHDARVIDHQRVTSAHIVGKIAHLTMLQPSVCMDNKHARAVAWAGGSERNALFRQLKIEQGHFHKGAITGQATLFSPRWQGPRR